MRPVGLLLLLLLILLAAASGCVVHLDGADFVQTDPSFRRDHTRGEVEVFLDRRPEGRYRSVGIIEVKREDLQAAVDAAVDKAREVGCDYLIDRSLHSAQASQTGVHQFICGVV